MGDDDVKLMKADEVPSGSDVVILVKLAEGSAAPIKLLGPRGVGGRRQVVGVVRSELLQMVIIKSIELVWRDEVSDLSVLEATRIVLECLLHLLNYCHCHCAAIWKWEGIDAALRNLVITDIIISAMCGAGCHVAGTCDDGLEEEAVLRGGNQTFSVQLC
jgi:hypothetical protein